MEGKMLLTFGIQLGVGVGGSITGGPIFTNADLEEYTQISNHAGFTLSDDALLGALSSEYLGAAALLGLEPDYGWRTGEFAEPGPKSAYVGLIGGGEEFSV